MGSIFDDEPKKKHKKKTTKKKITKKKITKKRKSSPKKQSYIFSKNTFKDLTDPERKALKWTMNSKPAKITKEQAKKAYEKIKNNPTVKKEKLRLFTMRKKFCPNCGAKNSIHQFPNAQWGCRKCNSVWRSNPNG